MRVLEQSDEQCSVARSWSTSKGHELQGGKNYVLPKEMFIIVKFVSGMGSNVGHSQKTEES